MKLTVANSNRENDTGEDLALKGDTPFAAMVESLTDQFEEFKETGSIQMDRTNYIDGMNNAVAISDQINSTVEYQFDAEAVRQMKELFDNTVLDLMDVIDIDLSQTPNPKDLAYILYTNFMLTDQRQLFFNHVVNMHVRSDGLESDIAIAHGKMLEDDPKDMYDLVENMFFPIESTIPYIVSFLESSGLSDILHWIEQGWLPESVLLEKFLDSKQGIEIMFTNYFQAEKERLQNG